MPGIEFLRFVSLGVDRISSSEDDVSSVSSDESSPPGSPPPEDSRCKYDRKKVAKVTNPHK